MKWYTEVEIVEITTGEIITKSEFERRNLKIIKKETKTEILNNYGKRKITWEVKENEQTRLFD